jgi:hypothetical protein
LQGCCAPGEQLALENTFHPLDNNQRVLMLRYRLQANETATLLTPTFIPPEAIEMPGYTLLASPTLYPGQTVRAVVVSNLTNQKSMKVRFQIESYGEADQLIATHGPTIELAAGETNQLVWQIPNLGGAPIVQVGIAISSDEPAEGLLHLDYLTWDGSPRVSFCRPNTKGRMWKRQWVNAADHFEDKSEDPSGELFRIIQNRGRGLVITGTREWTDYNVQATLTPHLARAFGLAVRVQGLERYYALLFCDQQTIKLIKHLDGEVVLAEQALAWEFGQPHKVQITVQDNHILAFVDGTLLFNVQDSERPLSGGGVALVCEAGRVGTGEVLVGPP